MERIRKFNNLWPLTYAPVKYVIDVMTDYKLKHNSGKPTGLMGASYIKLGNRELDIVSFLKSDKLMGKMPLIAVIDHKQKVAVTFVPPPKLIRTLIEQEIGYARTDKEAMNKANEFRKAIKNGLDFYNHRRK